MCIGCTFTITFIPYDRFCSSGNRFGRFFDQMFAQNGVGIFLFIVRITDQWGRLVISVAGVCVCVCVCVAICGAAC